MRKLMLMMVATTAMLAQANDLNDVFDHYTQLQSALAADNIQAAKKSAAQLAEAAEKVATDDLEPSIKKDWKTHGDSLKKAAQSTARSNLTEARFYFETISKAAIALAETAQPKGLAVYRCPMAFNNKGADWLQKKGAVSNPYYGSGMLRCGYEVKNR